MMMKSYGEAVNDQRQRLDMPPGFRFHPTDDELVVHYLCRKCAGQSISVPIIADIDLYKFDPWQLPGLALYGEKEWYFFSPRDRKYPNGSRPNRAAGTGYWKATGADKPVGKPKTLGIKKALVFYAGKAPKGLKTNWIMHEYRLANVDRSAGKRSNLRLDDWVLCRIYNKKGTVEKNYNAVGDLPEVQEQKPNIIKQPGTALLQAPPRPLPAAVEAKKEHVQFDTSESVPKWHTESSCCSEQVMSPAGFAAEKEVQSAAKWDDMDFQLNNFIDPMQDDLFHYQQYNDPFQDLFMYSNKPF
ncbi:unnamed protein product [Cuscuta campestris]|uniref:NAC domain-containing protein n=1 Tax=Cuscuta campestris TaxID=132261 RepID=A0A484KCK6_9ASTE|nr:unnamed protein product [Cuscuta campestris]